MTLRSKTLITISITVVLLIGILYGSAQFILLSSFRELEVRNTQQILKSAINVHQQSVLQLRDRFADWANWDDAYNFVANGNPEFVTSNLTEAALSTLNNNVMIFTDSTGKMVWGTGFDIATGLSAEINPDVLAKVGTDDPLFNRSSETDYLYGFLMTTNGPMIVASRPILTSENTGPIRGTLVVGFYFDQTRISKLADVTQLSLTAFPYDSSKIQMDENTVASNNLTTFVHPVDDQTISGYQIVNDIYGKPAMIFKIDIPRDLYNSGLDSVNYFIIALIVIGGVIGLVIIVSLEFIVIRKVRNLSYDVTKIGHSRDLSLRVEVSGNDELSNLSKEINEMLGSKESAQKELSNSQTQLAQAEKMASLGQMVAGLAHEINTPLGYVRSSVESLKDLTEDNKTRVHQLQKTHRAILSGSPEELDSIIAENESLTKEPNITDNFTTQGVLFHSAIDGLDKIGELVNSLKNFSRLDEADMKEADINENLNDVLKISNHITKGIVTVEKSFGKIPPTLCYPAQLNQVFINLIVNAAHACESKQKRVTDYKGRINLTTSASDNFISVKVTDNGIGISEDLIGRIFEPFFTTKPVGQGTGLGLSIAYKIIDKHDGKITVESRPGEGTTFVVQIPVRRQSEKKSTLFAEE